MTEVSVLTLHPLCLAVTLIVGVVTPASVTRDLLLSRPVESLLLEQHNIFRQEEKAANIFKLHWNQSVAAAAEGWAAGCEFRHQLTGEFGENLYYSSGPFDDNEKEILLSGLEAWHNEKRSWRYTSESCGSACHYTQIVWHSTTSVGCAYKRCQGLKVGSRRVDEALYLVCLYYPRGNWMGEYPFKIGRPCSSCESGTCQDGLCLEVTSFSSYHSEEVNSGSSFRWSYGESPGQGIHHHTSHSRFFHQQSTHNITSSSLRHLSQHHIRHSATHLQHDVSQSSSLEEPQQLSAPLYSPRQHLSHSSLFEKAAELRQREVTYRAGGNVQRELEIYNPARHSTLQSSSAELSEQYPRRAQNTHASSQKLESIELQRDAESRGPSPLDVLHADSFWCRDRLPSCRIWTSECSKSKAVYLSCPRTCGHCKNGNDTKQDALQERAPVQPRSQPQPIRQQAAVRDDNRPEVGQGAKTRLDERKGQRVGSRKDQNQTPQKSAKRTGGRSEEDRRKQRQQRQRQREEERRRRQQQKQKRKEERQHVHRKYNTVDRRAENLAETLRRETVNSRSCTDDPKYIKSCPNWVGDGFCSGNELMSTVYCRKSCGTC